MVKEKKNHTKAENKAIKLEQAKSKISRLEVSKGMKKRVHAITTSTNRQYRRTNQKNMARINSNGIPAFDDISTPEKYEAFKIARSNKKIIKALKHIVNSKIGYTKSNMVEAKKCIKNPAKYTDFDLLQANKLVTRLGKYPNMICIDDVISKIKRTSDKKAV